MLGMLVHRDSDTTRNSSEEDKIHETSSHKASRKRLNGNPRFDTVSKPKENKVGYVEHSVVKTIAAFLNTHPGGSLLIGVEEDEQQKGVIRGNAEDDFATNDVCERHIIQIINRDIGNLWSVDVDPQGC